MGILQGIISGILLGFFALPMKKITVWNWDKIWLVFSFFALIILPLIWALYTVPGLLQTYKNVAPHVLILVFLLGAGWGVSSISFGKGLSTLGLATGTAIILGLNNAVGSIMPIVIFTPEYLVTNAGIQLIISISIMILGILICSLAGHFKTKTLQKGQTDESAKFKKGLFLCIASGLLGPMLNFALIIGKPLETEAVNLGASALNAANPTWCIALLGGFTVILLYCGYRILTEKPALKIVKQKGSAAMLYSFSMALMWYSGVALYGSAVMNLGKLGASIGWPLIQSTAIASGNIAGIVTGEWKGTGKKPLATMVLGILTLIIGMIAIAVI